MDVCIDVHSPLTRCRRVQLALTRALLVLQDASRREITRDWEKRERVFRYYLMTGKEIPENIRTNISRKNSWWMSVHCSWPLSLSHIHTLSLSPSCKLVNLSRAKHIQSSSPEEKYYSQEGFNSSYSHMALPLHHGNMNENGSYLLASNTVSEYSTDIPDPLTKIFKQKNSLSPPIYNFQGKLSWAYVCVVNKKAEW